MDLSLGTPEEKARRAEKLDDLRKTLRKEHLRFAWRKICGNKKLIAVGVIVSLVSLTAVFAPVLSTHSPYAIEVPNRLRPPSGEHFFGTDAMGRDVFSRVLYGARISIGVGFSVGVMSVALGLIIGLYASSSPILDDLLMRVCDGLKAIPQILLAIALMSVLGAM